MPRPPRGVFPVLIGVIIAASAVARAGDAFDYSSHAQAILGAADAREAPAEIDYSASAAQTAFEHDDPTLADVILLSPLAAGAILPAAKMRVDPKAELPFVSTSALSAGDVVVPVPIVGLGQCACVAAAGILAGRRMLRRA